jgi:hypothetical protein
MGKLIDFLICLLASVVCMMTVSCGEKPATEQPGPTDKTPASEEAQSVAEIEPEIVPFDPKSDFELGDPEIGREYFSGENRGRCLTCHTLNSEGEGTGWALDDTGLRRDKQWLAIFLDNPRNLRPEVVRMPPFRGDEVATIPDVIAFLLTLRTPVDHPAHTDVKPADEPDMWEGGVGGRHGTPGSPHSD